MAVAVLTALTLTSCTETTPDDRDKTPAEQFPPALSSALPQTEAAPLPPASTTPAAAVSGEFHAVSDRGWKYQVSLQISAPQASLILGDPGEAEAAVDWTGTVNISNATPSRPLAPLAGAAGSALSIILYWKLSPDLRKKIDTKHLAIGNRAQAAILPEQTSPEGQVVVIGELHTGFATMKEETARELVDILSGTPDAVVLTAEQSIMAGAVDPNAAGECGISAFGPDSNVVGAVDATGRTLNGEQLSTILGGANVPGSALSIDCTP